jgi:hypothetical protein
MIHDKTIRSVISNSKAIPNTTSSRAAADSRSPASPANNSRTTRNRSPVRVDNRAGSRAANKAASSRVTANI